MWETAVRAIEDALATGNAGVPVAVHLILQSAKDTQQSNPQARVATTAWLRDEVASEHVLKSPTEDHSSCLLRFRSGKMALLSIGHCASAQEFLKILVICNHGIISWENDDGIRLDLSSAIERPARTPIREGIEPPYGVLLVAGDHTHQPNYSSVLAADPRCRLVGLTDSPDIPARRKELNAQLAKTLDIPVLADVNAAFARDDVQIVSICAEPFRRGALVAQAARAGKHLYLDKPFVTSHADANEVVASAKHAGVVTNMFSFLHVDAFQRMRQVIHSGRVGRLISLHCDLFFAKGAAGTAALGPPRVESPAPERYELADAKRELTNVGVYCLSNVAAVLGSRIQTVGAATGNFFFAEHQQNDMEDFGQMLLRMADGVTCTISAGRTGWHSCPSFGLNRVWIVGSQGSVSIDADRPRVEIWSDARPWSPPPRNPDDPMGMWMLLGEDPHRPEPKQTWITRSPALADADVAHFLDAIQFGYACDVDVEIAAHTTEALLAAYQSAASSELVDLPTPNAPKP